MKKLLISACLLLAGCVNTQAVMNSWNGRPISEVVYTFGPASSTQKMPDGNTIYAYDGTSYRIGISYPCKVMFVAGTELAVSFLADHFLIGACDDFLSGKARQ